MPYQPLEILASSSGSTGTVVGSVCLLAGSTANTLGNVYLSGGTTGYLVGYMVLSTGLGGAAIDPRSLSTGVLTQVVGNTTHDAVDAGAPVKIGGIARTANPAAVANLDRVDAMFDDIGRQVVVLGQARDLLFSTGVTITSSTAETAFVAAGAAGVFKDITDLIITNASTATPVGVEIASSSGGTFFPTIFLAERGGAVLNFARPWNQATAAASWTARLSVATVTVHLIAKGENNV